MNNTIFFFVNDIYIGEQMPVQVNFKVSSSLFDGEDDFTGKLSLEKTFQKKGKKGIFFNFHILCINT